MLARSQLCSQATSSVPVDTCISELTEKQVPASLCETTTALPSLWVVDSLRASCPKAELRKSSGNSDHRSRPSAFIMIQLETESGEERRNTREAFVGPVEVIERTIAQPWPVQRGQLADLTVQAA